MSNSLGKARKWHGKEHEMAWQRVRKTAQSVLGSVQIKNTGQRICPRSDCGIGESRAENMIIEAPVPEAFNRKKVNTMGLFLFLILFLLLLISAAYICYRIVFVVPPAKKNADPHNFPGELHYGDQAGRIHELINDVMKFDYEDVFIQSRDHLRLHGMLYHVSDDAPAEILFHGYQSIAVRDFCGGLQLALKAGHNALLVDQRAHGQSEGNALSFGILERYDCVSWIEYIRERFGENSRIILVGISMGAATVLQAGGLPLPEDVAGIIADSGYTAPADIIKKVAADRHLPGKLIYPLIRWGGRIFGGFDIEEDSAEEALKRCSIPVLIIHGENDGFVPCEMGRRNYEACSGKKSLFTFPGAEHGLSYLVDPERYSGAVSVFLEEILQSK